MRHILEPAFGERLFSDATKRKSERELGELLGYRWNLVYRFRKLREGGVTLSREQIAVLSKVTGYSVAEIMKHTREVHVRGPYAEGRQGS